MSVCAAYIEGLSGSHLDFVCVCVCVCVRVLPIYRVSQSDYVCVCVLPIYKDFHSDCVCVALKILLLGDLKI